MPSLHLAGQQIRPNPLYYSYTNHFHLKDPPSPAPGIYLPPPLTHFPYAILDRPQLHSTRDAKGYSKRELITFELHSAHGSNGHARQHALLDFLERPHTHQLEGRRLQEDGDGEPDRGGVPPGAGEAGASGRGGGGAAVVEALQLPPGARAGGRARRIRLRRHLRVGPPPAARPPWGGGQQADGRAERGHRVPGHAAARAHHQAGRGGRAPPAGAQQPARVREARRRAAGAQGHHRQVRVRERLPLRTLPGRRLRAPDRQDAHGVAAATAAAAAAATAAAAAGVPRVLPLQRALPVAAHGRAEGGEDHGLPAQDAPHRRRRRRQVARQGAQERRLRQLRARLHQARQRWKEVVRLRNKLRLLIVRSRLPEPDNHA